MAFDKACITIAGAYQAARDRAGQKAPGALQASSMPSSAQGTSQQLSQAGAMQGHSYGEGHHTTVLFTSKEASMAAVCREVAVKGFDPMPNVFGMKEW